MNAKKVLTLSFLPASADCGLLALRLWFGLSMLLIHGMGKVQNFSATLGNFEKSGIPTAFGVAAILSESLCSALLVLGIATRWAALFLMITMATAFSRAHHFNLVATDPHSGERAFLYLGAFVTLLIAGAGCCSIDAKLKSRPEPATAP